MIRHRGLVADHPGEKDSGRSVIVNGIRSQSGALWQQQGKIESGFPQTRRSVGEFLDACGHPIRKCFCSATQMLFRHIGRRHPLCFGFRLW